MPLSRPQELKCTVLALALALATSTGLAFAQQAPAPAPGIDVLSLKLAPGTAADASHATGSVQFIGTATVLIRYQGFTIRKRQISTV